MLSAADREGRKQSETASVATDGGRPARRRWRRNTARRCCCGRWRPNMDVYWSVRLATGRPWERCPKNPRRFTFRRGAWRRKPDRLPRPACQPGAGCFNGRKVRAALDRCALRSWTRPVTPQQGVQHFAARSECWSRSVGVTWYASARALSRRQRWGGHELGGASLKMSIVQGGAPTHRAVRARVFGADFAPACTRHRAVAGFARARYHVANPEFDAYFAKLYSLHVEVESAFERRGSAKSAALDARRRPGINRRRSGKSVRRVVKRWHTPASICASSSRTTTRAARRRKSS